MTPMPPHDPLVALWQTAPMPDTHYLAQSLERLNRLHLRLSRSVFAILCGMAILLIFEEGTGRLSSHGILSMIWIFSLVVGVIWRRRAQCNRSDALTLDTVSLLKLMIKRAKSDLFVARCLYAGAPCGALVAYLVMKAAGMGTTGAVATNPHLYLIQTAAGVAALVVMMAAGAILSRSRRLQVQEFTRKLKSIEAAL